MSTNVNAVSDAEMKVCILLGGTFWADSRVLYSLDNHMLPRTTSESSVPGKVTWDSAWIH